MKRRIIKKVPATTNNITTGIINFLLSEGHSASRVNVMGIYDEMTRRWRPSGSRNGFYDIACTLHSKFLDHRGQPIGITLMIDTKRGTDSLRKDQEEFKAEVEAAGGLTFESKDYNDFVFWYNTYLKKYYL